MPSTISLKRRPRWAEIRSYFHLDDVDLERIARKRGEHNRLGFAVQLGTVRYLGVFLSDPLDVPPTALQTLARQLYIASMDGLRAYQSGEQRWDRVQEICAQYGYVEITEPLVGWRLTRCLYALCWTGTDRPSVLFERAKAWLMTHKVLLPGGTILERHVARLRSRVELRLWRSLDSGSDSDITGSVRISHTSAVRLMPRLLAWRVNAACRANGNEASKRSGLRVRMAIGPAGSGGAEDSGNEPARPDRGGG